MLQRQSRSVSAIPFGQSSAAIGPTDNPQAQHHQQQIPAEFRCFLCKSFYNDPLLLSCSHSFCRRCVEPWLRQSTNCPHCRFTTLAPIRNTALIEKIEDYKQRNGSKFPNAGGGGNFIRSFVRRTMRPPSKEARTLQREAVRASQRRPKNVVLPERMTTPMNSLSVEEIAASLQGKLRLNQNCRNNKGKKIMEESANTFPRMENLRRSFARIRRKMSGKTIPEEPEIKSENRSNSVSGFQMNNNNYLHSQHSMLTIGELLARNQQQENFLMMNDDQQYAQRQNGIIETVSFTEINLQSPANTSYNSMANWLGPRRPSMGVSGTALRLNSTPNTPIGEKRKTALNGKNGTKNAIKNNGGNRCILM